MAREIYVGVGSGRQDLPTGYTGVEYIESSGTQYIDTGFKPNQDTRVVMDIQYLSGNTAAASALFGARTSTSSKAYAIQYNTSNGNLYHFYNAGYTSGIAVSEKENRLVYDTNKNVLTVGGVTNTRNYAAFQCDYNMYLLASNNAGTASFQMYAKLYSCQIYDNGTLIRDFVPCQNSSGTLGLYDVVNNVFYTNAGTGSFTAGAVGADIARKITRVYVGVSGVARNIESGYVGVSGVARQFFPSGAPVSDLAVGDSVYMNVNGVSTEFLIVHQGLPSSAYDSSCNGIWLLMKNIHSKIIWEDTDGEQWVGNNYKLSDIHNYLTNTVLQQFDSSIQSKIKTVKIPYTNGVGNAGSVASGSSGLSTKLFLLSAAEVSTEVTDARDIGQTGVSYNREGSVLDYFDCSNDPAHDDNVSYHTNRVATYNGTETPWSLRSPDTTGQVRNFEVQSDVALGKGRIMAMLVYGEGGTGVRPALILPSTTLVDNNFNVIA